MKKYSFLIFSFLVIGANIISCQNDNSQSNERSKLIKFDAPDPLAGLYQMPFALGLPQSPTQAQQDSGNLFLQNRADEFSWRQFIALNWSANADGSPDSTAKFGGNGSGYNVFEHWMPTTSLFRENGLKPLPWNYKFDKNGAKPEFEDGLRVVAKLERFGNNDSDNHHVIDQNGNYTYYRVFYNKQMYDYIVKGKLYSKVGQFEFATKWPSNTEGLTIKKKNGQPYNIEKNLKRLYFPVGGIIDSTKILNSVLDSLTFHFTVNPGAVIAKTAWRVLTDKDDKSRYFVTNVKYKGKETIVLGLVGMHLMHKVSEVTQWVWSSFEHVDNSPQMNADGSVNIEKNVKYSYFDSKNLDKSLFNQVTSAGTEETETIKKPTQVVKILPAEPNAEKLNKKYQALIRASNPKSEWQYYRLVGTQWPLNPVLLQFGSGYTPNLLANSVMETYIQENSSCMGCHSKARFLFEDKRSRNAGYNSDFVWGLANVKK